MRGVSGVAQSTKSGDLTLIGRFGIGFKSVYAYTKNPRIYSSEERFRIESYVRPFPIDPDPDPEPDGAGAEAAPGSCSRSTWKTCPPRSR